MVDQTTNYDDTRAVLRARLEDFKQRQLQAAARSAPKREDATSLDNKLPAVNRVFGIVEPGEMILLQLPPAHLLRLQKVCRTWRDNIVGSSRIQEYLFFKPVTSHRLIWVPMGLRPVTQRSDINWLYWPWAPYGEWYHHGRIDFGAFFPLQNPFLDILFNPQRDTNRGMTHEHASWRRQLLTQPPVSEVRFSTTTQGFVKSTATPVSPGLVMGNFADNTVIRIEGSSRWEIMRDSSDVREVKAEALRKDARWAAQSSSGNGIPRIVAPRRRDRIPPGRVRILEPHEDGAHFQNLILNLALACPEAPAPPPDDDAPPPSSPDNDRPTPGGPAEPAADLSSGRGQ